MLALNPLYTKLTPRFPGPIRMENARQATWTGRLWCEEARKFPDGDARQLLEVDVT